MPRGSFFIRSGRVRITYLPAIETRDARVEDLPALMDRVRGAIAQSLEKELP
jgi:hypothetical protein